MNVFERHGIDHLSASSINLYVEQPAKWCLQYPYGFRDEAGPGAWRGSAIEAGLDWWLFNRNDITAIEDSLSATHRRFEEDAQGDLSDEVEKERVALEDFLRRAIEACSSRPVPNGRQIRVEHYIDGIEVPILMFVDYSYDEFDDDLKTTWRMPSAITGAHARQAALYSTARNKPCTMTYVTPKRSESYALTEEEVSIYMNQLAFYARRIRDLLTACPDKESIARVVCPDYDHPYLWKNEAARNAAMEIWK